jgi:hypothetical protein
MWIIANFISTIGHHRRRINIDYEDRLLNAACEHINQHIHVNEPQTGLT